MKEYRKARYDAIKTVLEKGPSGAPKEEVIVNEASRHYNCFDAEEEQEEEGNGHRT
jgi:hypothetical protein